MPQTRCPHGDPSDLSGLREQILANAKVLYPLLTGNDNLPTSGFDLVVLRDSPKKWYDTSSYHAYVLYNERLRGPETSITRTLLASAAGAKAQKALEKMLKLTANLLSVHLANDVRFAPGMIHVEGEGCYFRGRERCQRSRH